MLELTIKVLGVSIEEFFARFGETKESILEFIKKGLRYGVVYTHSGPEFHADETFALALLEIYRKHLNEIGGKELYPPFKVIRSRNVPKSFKGLVLDEGYGFLDHHFKKELAAFRNNGIQYATAGILWYVLGLELVTIDYFEEVDYKIFQNVDALDNGQNADATLCNIIASFVPNWDETDLVLEEQMKLAIDFAEKYLERTIKNCSSRNKAKEHILKDMNTTEDKIVGLSKSMPWQEVLVPMSAEYVVFYNGLEWCAQVVPVKPGSFEFKNGKGFPVHWRGLRNSDLEKVCDITDVVFCHNTGFFMAGKTKESMFKACEIALES